MAVSLSGTTIPTEVMGHIMTFVPPLENIRNTRLVCKEWEGIASHVAKFQLIDERLANINNKAASFLSMVPEKLASYCLSYARLQTVRDNLEAATLQEVYIASEYATEKYSVCIVQFLRVNPDCPDIPEEKKSAIAGKVFVELRDRLWTGSGPIYNSPRYLPIELFKFTVDDCDYTVTGDKNKGSVCFALSGALIELMIVEANENNYKANSSGIPALNRHTIHTVDFWTSQNFNVGQIWAKGLYVAEFNARE